MAERDGKLLGECRERCGECRLNGVVFIDATPGPCRGCVDIYDFVMEQRRAERHDLIMEFATHQIVINNTDWSSLTPDEIVAVLKQMFAPPNKPKERTLRFPSGHTRKVKIS